MVLHARALTTIFSKLTAVVPQDGQIEGKGRHTRILNVNILTKDGLATNVYHSDDFLILDTIIETDGTKGISLDLYVVNSAEQRIYFYNSNLFGRFDVPTCSGCYKFRMTFRPLMLASGDYRIDLATSLTNIGHDHYVSNATNFRIPFFNPTGNSWDFKDSTGSGMIALVLENVISDNYKPL